MANVVFCQTQNFFNSNPFARWARLIVYEDDYSDSLNSASPFLFMFNEQRCIGIQKIPVGISETEYFSDTSTEYEEHKKEIVVECQ